MEMTLDEFLAEVDRWKQPVSDEMAPLSPAERARLDAEARAWLEEKLGRPLQEAPSREGSQRGSKAQ